MPKKGITLRKSEDNGFYVADTITKIQIPDGRYLEVYYAEETGMVGLAIWDNEALEGESLFMGKVPELPEWVGVAKPKDKKVKP